jgi:hypothetical protein
VELFSKSTRFLNPGQLYEDKPYINYKMVHSAIQRHIIQANPSCHFDFFLHCWNTDLKDDLVNLYQPVDFLFEDNNLYRDEIMSKCNHPSEFAGPSQCYH